MTYWIIGIVVFLIVWTFSGIFWFLMNLGNKTGPGHWYDYVFSPPVFAIIHVMNWFRRPQ
jgi:hypothetical protein